MFSRFGSIVDGGGDIDIYEKIKTIKL